MSEQSVKIYTANGWGPCQSAKEYLSQKGVTFVERNVSVDASALQELVGTYKSRGTPTIVIGNEVIIGFDRGRIDELLTTA
jgi:glutaredoxin 3